jgi:hypothetical protein
LEAVGRAKLAAHATVANFDDAANYDQGVHKDPHLPCVERLVKYGKLQFIKKIVFGDLRAGNLPDWASKWRRNLKYCKYAAQARSDTKKTIAILKQENITLKQENTTLKQEKANVDESKIHLCETMQALKDANAVLKQQDAENRTIIKQLLLQISVPSASATPFVAVSRDQRLARRPNLGRKRTPTTISIV